MLTGKFRIEELELRAKIGETIEERCYPQRILLSISFSLDITEACETDDINTTVDYGEVVSVVEDLCANKDWCLIETMVRDIKDLLQEQFPIEDLRVSLQKFPIKGVKAICLEL